VHRRRRGARPGAAEKHPGRRGSPEVHPLSIPNGATQEDRHLINGQRLAVVMPAYNAEVTLERTYAELPRDIVDTVIVVDDFSRDGTAALTRRSAP
jgi:Glycosyl transferase family 2